MKKKRITQQMIRKAQSQASLGDIAWHVYTSPSGLRAMPYELRPGELRREESKLSTYRGVSRKTAIALARAGALEFVQAA